jgi:type II secretory pathway predicted ATPase ExeA
MLVLVGLPTLFPKLVDARTFSERMFEVITLSKLPQKDSREAIVQPIHQAKSPVNFTEESILLIIKTSGGYPYFIQFICREIYDIFLQKNNVGEKATPVSIHEIVRKLDKDFLQEGGQK